MQLNDRNILTHAGKVSHQMALEKAGNEYEQFYKKQIKEQAKLASDFDITLKQIEQAKKNK